MAQRLTAADAAKLAADPSAQNRTEMAAKLSEQFAAGDLSEDERRIATIILEKLIHDTEVRVRSTLSANLKACPFLPRNVAVTLAQDLDEVALPVIELSPVLTERDLVSIVRDGSTAKQIGVAKRESVPEAISEALVETGKQKVVESLLRNEAADIPQKSYEAIMDRFAAVETVESALAERHSLPVSAAEEIARRLSDALLERLMRSRRLSPQLSCELVVNGYENAIAHLDADGMEAAELWSLVSRLEEQQHLTAGFLLRMLFAPNLRLFCAAVAKLANLTPSQVEGFAARNEWSALNTLYGRAQIPASLYPALRAGWELATKARGGDKRPDESAFTQQAVAALSEAYRRQRGYPEEVGQLLMELRAWLRRNADGQPRSAAAG